MAISVHLPLSGHRKSLVIHEIDSANFAGRQDRPNPPSSGRITRIREDFIKALKL